MDSNEKERVKEDKAVEKREGGKMGEKEEEKRQGRAGRDGGGEERRAREKMRV